jgi:dTDP-4-dehydrorhamnose reductase
MSKKESNKRTILIFGVSSFVGSNLAEYLKHDFKIIGTYFKTKANIPGILTLPCDVLDKDQVQLVIYAFKPDLVIYAVGMSSIKDCSENIQIADALNTGGLINVSEYCQRYKAKICFISSNFVFGGEKKEYIEMDIPDANTVYGKAMASSEFYIQKTSLNYIIFRCCKLYGRGINPTKPTWFENIQRSLYINKNITLDNKIHTGFLDIYYLALVIKICLGYEVTNRMFQISSTDEMSLFEFATMYASTFSQSKNLISKGSFHFPEISGSGSGSRELFYAMDLMNIEGFLHIKLPSVEESLKLTFDRFHGKWVDRGETSAIKFI